ncbi:hypothetical protein A2U01_0105893, partial [Trifolium medium]|nr:hypothetical protein [Trifolium medium]
MPHYRLHETLFVVVLHSQNQTQLYCDHDALSVAKLPNPNQTPLLFLLHTESPVA